MDNKTADQIEEKKKLTIALSNQIDKLIVELRTKHNLPVDIEPDALLFSVFKTVNNMIKSNLMLKREMETYVMLAMNEYLSSAGMNLYIKVYEEPIKPAHH